MAMMLHLPSPTVFTPNSNSNSKFQRSHFSSRQIPSTFVTSIQAQPHHLSPSSSSSKTFLSPPLITAKPSSIRCLTARSLSNLPLISPNDHWGTWTSLFAVGAFGIWSERTKIGSTLSGALVSILAIADLRRVIKSTGTLLLAFLLGSVGTVVAYVLVPMRSLGQDSWKIAAALMGRHIGGDVAMDVDSEPGNKLPVLRMATALAVSFAICKTGTFLAKYFGIQGGSLPAITAIVVILATAFPKQFAYLAPSGEAMALILMQVSLQI
uniref:Uncharacterized protein n=1 Tax=Quercus lobata TaxID=97700 RepID=A0A7N2MHX2_QUELO